jgi:hypothetical protein
MPPDRRSKPELQRTLSDLYPTPLASDPSELADQAQTLFQSHARAHERSLATHVASAGRINELEGQMQKAHERIVGLEGAVVQGMTALKETMSAGFADVKYERTVDRTKLRTTLAVLAVVWTAVMGVGGLALHYLTRPSCRPDQATIGDRCVEVQAVTVKR